MDLPNEIIDIILKNLEFDDLLNLRLVSSRWRDLIASFCSRQKSLMLQRRNAEAWQMRRWCHCIMNDRFFEAPKNERHRILQIEFKEFQNENFAESIFTLFPNVDFLVAHDVPWSESTFLSLAYLLHRWKNISTLIIEIEPNPPIGKRDFNINRLWCLLAAPMNGLEKLRRLDTNRFGGPELFRPMLERIHHLGVCGMINPLEFLHLVRFIGPNCRRLWTSDEVWSVFMGRSTLQTWIDANPSLFDRLTHFAGPLSMESDFAKFVDSHLKSVEVWYSSADLNFCLTPMRFVSRVKELHVGCFWGVLPSFDATVANGMNNVHTFEFRCVSYSYTREAIRKFCTELALFVPNVKHLIFVPSTQIEREYFKENLYLFKNLLSSIMK